MSERTPIFKTVEEAQKLIENRVSLLNRLMRQHPKSPAWVTWYTIKEYFEKELLGYEVTWET